MDHNAAHNHQMDMTTTPPVHKMVHDQAVDIITGGSMHDHAGMNMTTDGYNILSGNDHQRMMSGHGAHAHAHHSLIYFHTEQNDIILFEQWKLSPGKVTFISCLALLIAAVLYEGLKTARQRIGRPCPNIQCKRYILNRYHIIQTFLYTIQFVAGYLIMLAVMTYNVWILIATVLGLGLGYFFFGWSNNDIVKIKRQTSVRQKTFAADCSTKTGEQELLPLSNSESCTDPSGNAQTDSLVCKCNS